MQFSPLVFSFKTRYDCQKEDDNQVIPNTKDKHTVRPSYKTQGKRDVRRKDDDVKEDGSWYKKTITVLEAKQVIKRAV